MMMAQQPAIMAQQPMEGQHFMQGQQSKQDDAGDIEEEEEEEEEERSLLP
jgi:hypothetical protein